MNSSRAFYDTELKWSAIEKELSALKDSLTNFRVYLAGSNFIYDNR